MNAPCMNCQERELGCHDNCQKFSEYKIIWENILEKKKHENILNRHDYDRNRSGRFYHGKIN